MQMLLSQEQSSYRRRWAAPLDGVCCCYSKIIFLLTPPFAAFIISVAFNMGTDTATILQNPIGQPMATVRR